ncbi:MAG: type II secretion system F family protein [Phycisphaeraceae bacterium]|nr:type II secretion system F family protein [Phycisphaeraceae bacterium]
MKFAYTAYDRAGKPDGGQIEAAAEAEAVERLRRQGLFVVEVRPAPDGEDSRTPRRAKGGKVRQKHKRLSNTLRQLSILISTGTTIVEALSAVERQTSDGAWRAVLSDIRQRVEQGESLSSAMGAHPGCFDSVSQSLVAAGESGGNLHVMLDRLGALLRQQQKMRASLIGSMVYPCLLITVSVCVLTMMIVFVLPRFAGMFEDLGLPLPASTQALMAVSDAIRTWWWAGLAGLVGLGTGGVVWLRTPPGRRAFDSTLVRLPIFGRIARDLQVGRIARLLGTLMEGRVPLLESIELTRRSLGNVLYRELLDRAQDMVTRGEPMSAALASSALVPESMTEAVRSGERSGAVGRVLSELATYIEEDNETLVRSLTSILEPIILLGLGVVVSIVALSMFLPLFDLAAASGVQQ